MFGSYFFAMFFLYLIGCIGLTILVYSVITKKWSLFRFAGKAWLVACAIFLVVAIRNYFTDKMKVDAEDVYGTYVIHRTMFPGKNANWQYDHYRFEITKPFNFNFYVTNRKVVLRTYKGTVDISPTGVIRPHVIYTEGETPYHILSDNPTLYRRPFSFYYVFHSPLYGNMYFTKGEYKMADD